MALFTPAREVTAAVLAEDLDAARERYVREVDAIAVEVEARHADVNSRLAELEAEDRRLHDLRDRIAA